MNYFAPGYRELSRKLGRLRSRLRMALARRDLEKSETELGLLGWQQAEFDQETQSEVNKITEYERKQSELTNSSAGLGKELRELREERETGRKAFEEKRRELHARRAGLTANHPQIEKQLTELRKAEPTFERRMPELDRELREINKLYTGLLSRDVHTPQIKNELTRLRERTVSIPNEKSDLRNQHLRTVSEIRALESQLERDREELTTIEHAMKETQAQFDASDGRLAGEIRTREREKARLEKEIDALESAKHNPYLQIGRVLADSDIAPMNQPGALDKVKRLRARVLEIEHLILLSRDASAIEDRQMVRLSFFLWGAVVLVFLLIVLAAVPWRGGG